LDIVKGSPYFGSFLGYIIFSYISDNFGRRKTMLMSLGLGTLGSIIVALGYNITMISVGMLMCGAGINVSGGMLFYFLGEAV
jgi:MFS family permease